MNTNIVDLNEYLQHILKSTNMKCLTPEKVSCLLLGDFSTPFLVCVLCHLTCLAFVMTLKMLVYNVK